MIGTSVGIGSSGNTANTWSYQVGYEQLQGDKFYYVDPKLNADVAISRTLKKMGGQPGTLILSDKPLVITKPIELASGQCIQGVGNNTKIDATAITGSAIIFDSNCHVKNINLFGLKHPNSIGISNKSSAALFRFDNVSINGFMTGVQLTYCWVGMLHNLICTGCDVGMNWTNFVNIVQVIGGHFGGNRVAIQSISKANYQLKNVITTTIEGNSQAGIILGDKNISTTVRDCYFELNGNNNGFGGDVVITGGTGTVIDACFGVRSMPMFHLVGGTNTRISNCVGWSKNFILIESGASNTIVDYNTYYSSGSYGNCKGIINHSSTTTFLSPNNSISLFSADANSDPTLKSKPSLK